MSQVPIATQLTLDAAGPAGRAAVESVVMIVCQKTDSKGTGFCLRNGWVLTNEHVVRGCNAPDVHAIDGFKTQIGFSDVRVDATSDLALLKPNIPLKSGLDLETGAVPEVGAAVTTWGFPLGYNGPAPLLSVGYLAGFTDRLGKGPDHAHLVVNGAFNPGNSGGPLFRANADKVIGIVVSKHAPITPFQLSALAALAGNKSGVVYTAQDQAGNTKSFVESQIVADLLEHFRRLTQVMIGEAISAATASQFIKAQGV